VQNRVDRTFRVGSCSVATKGLVGGWMRTWWRKDETRGKRRDEMRKGENSYLVPVYP
jgi:hypothetical protein